MLKSSCSTACALLSAALLCVPASAEIELDFQPDGDGEGKRVVADNPADVAAEKAQEAKEPEQAEKDKDALEKEAETKRKILSAITIIPNSLSISSSLSFDNDGVLRGDSSNASINFRVNYAGGISPVAYENFRLTRVLSSSGEELDVSAFNQHNSRSTISNNGNGGGSFYLHSQMPIPSRDAEAFELIEGEFEFTAATGKPLDAVFGPIKKFEGVWIGVESFPGSKIKIDRIGGQTRITMDAATFGKMDRPEFYSDNGQKIDVNGWSGSSNGTEASRTYRVNLPDNGKVVVWFYTDLMKVTVPMRIRDMPLPSRPKNAGVDMVIRLGEQPEIEEAARDREPDGNDREDVIDRGDAPRDGGLELVIPDEPRARVVDPQQHKEIRRLHQARAEEAAARAEAVRADAQLQLQQRFIEVQQQQQFIGEQVIRCGVAPEVQVEIVED